MYAVIATGGKQYRVQEGDTVYVEKIDQADGSPVTFDALMLSGEGGTVVGSPTVPGAKVEAAVVSQVKGEKIIVYKYKAKKNYRRKQGHRQPYTKLEIKSIRP
ncbi:MAG: 50S ribosomal protein L21 [Oscillospiraceae bacterium]|nr:50S ribosomal protein L21 [Oscillospiraceae bacterium]